jgi:hypothetical protein
MQFVLSEQWTVTVMDGWNFYLLANNAIKLLLFQEGKELWVHNFFY